jgi:hypothetical protein
MKLISASVLLVSATAVVDASITDHLLYEQLTPTSLGDSASVYYSNPAHDQVMYDQFRFDSATQIEGIGFWGSLYADSTVTISLYEQSSSGLPGTLVYTHDFARSDLGLTVSGSVVDDDWTTQEQHGIAQFDHAFSAQADTTYWLAITGDAFFSWTYGAMSGDDSVLYSNSAQDSFWTNADIDRDPTNLAFSVYGTSIPAPASVSTLALIGIYATRRRRAC